MPAWERERLPIVSRGQELLFAAGIGMDCAHVLEGGEDSDRIALGSERSLTRPASCVAK